MSTPVVTRFAPSPTGHLHIGGARTAIFSWLYAKHFNGRFVLRIEDTDTERSKQEYTDSILASMSRLGLAWDGDAVYQTQRFDLYNQYIDRLLDTGNAYRCECTPEEVEAMREKARAEGAKPRYNGRCRCRSQTQSCPRPSPFRRPAWASWCPCESTSSTHHRPPWHRSRSTPRRQHCSTASRRASGDPASPRARSEQRRHRHQPRKPMTPRCRMRRPDGRTARGLRSSTRTRSRSATSRWP